MVVRAIGLTSPLGSSYWCWATNMWHDRWLVGLWLCMLVGCKCGHSLRARRFASVAPPPFNWRWGYDHVLLSFLLVVLPKQQLHPGTTGHVCILPDYHDKGEGSKRSTPNTVLSEARSGPLLSHRSHMHILVSSNSSSMDVGRLWQGDHLYKSSGLLV